MRWVLFASLLFVVISFWFFLLSLMNMYPIYLSGPALFISIFITLHLLNERKRFKGFR